MPCMLITWHRVHRCHGPQLTWEATICCARRHTSCSEGRLEGSGCSRRATSCRSGLLQRSAGSGWYSHLPILWNTSYKVAPWLSKGDLGVRAQECASVRRCCWRVYGCSSEAISGRAASWHCHVQYLPWCGHVEGYWPAADGLGRMSRAGCLSVQPVLPAYTPECRQLVQQAAQAPHVAAPVVLCTLHHLRGDVVGRAHLQQHNASHASIHQPLALPLALT